MNAAQFTLQSRVPASIGTTIYTIVDRNARSVVLAVPYGGSVVHPLDSADGPWAVGYRIVGPSGSSDYSSETQKISDPHATLSVGFALSLDASAAVPVPAFGLPPTAALTMAVQAQKQTNWNWAAIASSVVAYYRSPAPEASSQCSLANWALNRNDCCMQLNVDCNRPFEVPAALHHVGCLRQFSRNRLDFASVQQEIAAGRPVVAILRADNASIGHAVVIVAYDALPGQQPLIHVVGTVPGVGTQIFPFQAFPGPGLTWIQTCTTQAPAR